jgi:hypothetical protein
LGVGINSNRLRLLGLLKKLIMSLGEDVMDRKEIVEMYMESPLYLTMPVRIRLEFIKRRENCFSDNGLSAKIY